MKTSIYALAVTVAVLVVAGICVWQLDDDPVYQGQRLSEHLKGCQDCGLSFGGGSSYGETVSVPAVTDSARLQSDVLSQVQPDSWPLLARLLEGKESPIKRWFRSFSQKHKILARLNRSKPTQVGALMAFRQLGSRAAPALPTIAKLLDRLGVRVRGDHCLHLH